MILHVCYNDYCNEFPKQVFTVCEEQYPNITVKTYSETHYQEKKKAFKLKGGYSARMTPFMLLTSDEGEYIKAFYSEAKDCTLESLINFLKTYGNTSN